MKIPGHSLSWCNVRHQHGEKQILYYNNVDIFLRIYNVCAVNSKILKFVLTNLKCLVLLDHFTKKIT